MLAYLFPGQGSQFRGMGGDLFDIFKSYTAEADAELGYSIKSLCIDDTNQYLNLTQYTQSAIYVVNALTYFKKKQETAQNPDYVSGHSLGEYNALLAAGVFDFKTGLKLVKKRGELMSEAKGGGMAAILGMDREAIQQMLNNHELSDICIANYNSKTQSVISGKEDDIKRAEVIFAKQNLARFIPLRVSGAFHSPYMTSAQNKFEEFLHSFEFNVPNMPVIANANSSPYHPQVTKKNLASQITSPVDWVGIIQYLKLNNVNRFEEIGVGNVLTKLLSS